MEPISPIGVVEGETLKASEVVITTVGSVCVCV
jgi:hypothetical protein